MDKVPAAGGAPGLSPFDPVHAQAVARPRSEQWIGAWHRNLACVDGDVDVSQIAAGRRRRNHSAPPATDRNAVWSR